MVYRWIQKWQKMFCCLIGVDINEDDQWKKYIPCGKWLYRQILRIFSLSICDSQIFILLLLVNWWLISKYTWEWRMSSLLGPMMKTSGVWVTHTMSTHVSETLRSNTKKSSPIPLLILLILLTDVRNIFSTKILFLVFVFMNFYQILL